MKFEVGEKVRLISDEYSFEGSLYKAHHDLDTTISDENEFRKNDILVVVHDYGKNVLATKKLNFDDFIILVNREHLEKIEDEYINFEDAIKLIKEGGKELQILHKIDGVECWKNLSIDNMNRLTIMMCLHEKFRIKPKKEKVKRYLVVFYWYDGSYKRYAMTDTYYKDESDFLEKFESDFLEKFNSPYFRDKNIMFESLVLGSEKEEDE